MAPSSVSQTEDRLPRILARFQEDLERHFKDTPEIQALQDSIQKLGQDPKRQEDRFYTGGIYSWQGAMRSTNSAAESSPGESKPPTVLARLSPLVRLFNVWILPILIGMVPTLFGAFTSGLVPPQGFNCRVWGEAAFFFACILSAILDFPLNSCFTLDNESSGKKLFWWTFAKDSFFFLGTTIWLVASVIGTLNRCDC